MLKRITVEQLRVGMYIHELCGSWMEHPFWRTRFALRDPHDLELIVDSGIREVWIDSAKGLDIEPGVTREETDAAVDATLMATAHPPPETRAAPLREELQRAEKICATSKQAVASMFQEARMGQAFNAKAAVPLVEEISASVTRNPRALISLARLKTQDDYTYLHSVAVCALMIALARQLELSDEHTRQAGMAGLLHDLGKALMPLEVLNKPGKLTDEEFRIMKGHPGEGHRLLVEGGAVGEIPLEVCLHHHEKMDGSGYPDRLAAGQISLFARMGAVCDVYDAITSNRPYKAGWDPAESIRKMAEWCTGHFDERIFHAFVRSVGIYPVGSLVRMASGRLGVVIDQSAHSLLTPHVKIFFSIDGKARIPPEIVDLAAGDCREKISGREDPAHWGFPDLDTLWMDPAKPPA